MVTMLLFGGGPGEYLDFSRFNFHVPIDGSACARTDVESAIAIDASNPRHTSEPRVGRPVIKPPRENEVSVRRSLLLLVDRDVVEFLPLGGGAGRGHGHRLAILRDDARVRLHDLAGLLSGSLDGVPAFLRRDRVVVARSG